ncbi:formate dehydrogenase, cytochrome b556(fdo) subunit [bacterium BMS3Abin07]|nr:formate dehydrogenase, cytochrome b556(fdo) subunit [bacterium BMS3Abin07]GBE32974.1 formate dehydrogenase, cytochrome b556(fdo) subunit [bacterium BMS3Bbin05]HDL21021.1 formate dehydrogenase subunit gamma [Nitrospirota bacterium]HDO22984.1 formate dehydrogenase subunit gamma [Nitrospirota bacterium]HDZ87674.1 formate dehydrogenase subunit gamma [Nitrospirota bacterium]
MTRMVQKTTSYERFVHWMMAISGITLLLTGFGFLYQNELGWINTVFGGQHVARLIHNWVGVVFTVSVILSMGVWLGEALSWSGEDSEWMGMLGGYLSKDLEPPPQGKLNAGQKLVVIVVVLCGLLIAASGFLMWLSPGSKNVMMWGHILHNLPFFVFAILIPIHIYLATAANPGTFRIMTKGWIPLYWAKKKHPKWVKEIGAD